MFAIIVDGQRIGDAAAGESQPLLAFEIGDFFGQSVTELVRLALKKTGLEKFRHVLRTDGAVRDAALGRFDFDARFEIKHAARPVAHDLHVFVLLFGFICDRCRNFVGADGESCGIAWDEYLDHYSAASLLRPATISSKRLGSTMP